MLIVSFGAAIAVTAVLSVGGMVALGNSVVSGSNRFLPKPQFHAAARMLPRLPESHAGAGKASRPRASAPQAVMVASLSVANPSRAAGFSAAAPKSARLPDVSEETNLSSNGVRFDEVVKKAALTSDKLASLFDQSSPAKKSHRPAAKTTPPARERFVSPPAATTALPLLAYADPSPTSAGAALSALLARSSQEDLASRDPGLDRDAAAVPDFEDLLAHPVPQPRPARDRAGERDAKPDARKAEEPAPKADQRATPKPRKLAYARPANPAEKKSNGGLGNTLRDLFGGGGAKAGNGVAVYDISAAKVYMPDGSVLEAHSGIGKMADNPRYAHVKMKGPTPPHTYNLRMREKLFHGVEAIRMLPVDGKNKHGRDGFLTHSYLLRGGREESHGCVAFKNYDRFLNAFKKGKVRQLVVVPSGGRGSMLAANGKRI